MDWIEKRAAEARKADKQRKWTAFKLRLIESHSYEFFEQLTALMEKSVAAFNEEFEGEDKVIESFEKSLNRFVVRRRASPAVELDCRLDYAKHEVRYQITGQVRGRKRAYQYDSVLSFDVSGTNKVLLLSPDQIPMSLEQVTQLLLEPFF